MSGLGPVLVETAHLLCFFKNVSGIVELHLTVMFVDAYVTVMLYIEIVYKD